MIVLETICDYKYRTCYQLIYERDTKVVSRLLDNTGMSEIDYKNKLYYYYDYEKPENKNKDIIWITDDNKIVEINDCDMKNIKDVAFFDKLRDLGTRERIINYLNFLEL